VLARQEKYDSANPVVSYLIRRFFERLRSVVAGLEPRSVLDAGCGEGELPRRAVLPPGVAYVGLDQNLESLREIGSGARVGGSVLALPFASESFDVVLCLEVLEHLSEPEAALRELSRVARRAMVLSVPHEPYFQMGNLLRGKYLDHLGNHPEHIQHWNPRSFERMLARVAAKSEMVEAFPWVIASCSPARPGVTIENR
jgi:ubiquinone/menaquinone biosynthesis C-methylase UbiE